MWYARGREGLSSVEKGNLNLKKVMEGEEGESVYASTHPMYAPQPSLPPYPPIR